MRDRVARLGVALLVCGGTALDCRSSAPQEKPPSEGTPIRSVALYVLSRGKGVPPEASEALRKVRELAEADRKRGVLVTIETKRIGIEGERRLCVEYRDPEEARRLHERAKALVKGVDLARLVVEPCAGGTPKGEEHEKEGEP